MSNSPDLDTFLREICAEPVLNPSEEFTLASEIVAARNAWVGALASTPEGVWAIIDLAESVINGPARLDEVFTFERSSDRQDVLQCVTALTEGLRMVHEQVVFGANDPCGRPQPAQTP